MDTYLSFFNLQKNYNKKDLDRAYQKKIASISKMNITTTEQKMFEEKTNEIYKILDSELNSKFMENTGSYEKMFNKSKPNNHKVIDPFSSLNSIVAPFFKQSFINDGSINDIFANESVETNSFTMTEQISYISSDLEGSKYVLHKTSTNNNGEKTTVIENYSVDSNGKKKPLSADRVKKIFESNYGKNNDLFIEN